MTKNDDNIKDWRSTGRRRGRRVLYEAYEDYVCNGPVIDGVHRPCGKTVIEPPKDAPEWFDEIWPLENRVLASQLQVQHLSKDHSDNSVETCKWLCPSCHKLEDNQTGVGETLIHTEFF